MVATGDVITRAGAVERQNRGDLEAPESRGKTKREERMICNESPIEEEFHRKEKIRVKSQLMALSDGRGT